jgi:hydroxyethylthiazole kinase-like uncharacterized protein yjeF
MQILSAEQIRLWDEFTILKEPISSIDLMERAALNCINWLEENKFFDRSFHIFCGKGNNGGDGLAIARMIAAKECSVIVYILEFGHKGTEDFQLNLARLHETEVEIRFFQSEDNNYDFKKEDILIDSLFGSGLNRPLEGRTARLIEQLNTSGNCIISIDIPSGLYTDKSSVGNVVVQATYTLSFQCFKLAFLIPENEHWLGKIQILDIGLLEDFLSEIQTPYRMVDKNSILSIIKPRNRFANKGNFGHVLLIAGSYGKMGAAVLCARACLKSGVGLLTSHVPKSGYLILQTAVPEAMVSVDVEEQFSSKLEEELLKYSSIGIGPGIGTKNQTVQLLRTLLNDFDKPIVIDADALNILSTHTEWLSAVPPYSILTPHPKEFERLFGPAGNDFEKLQLALDKSRQYQIVIVLKGHYTFITTPEGIGYFNTTGNPGMAKGGSGDALTGMIASFLAQKYSSIDAARLGVFMHGLAGDISASSISEMSLLPSDLIDHIGAAFLSLQQ